MRNLVSLFLIAFSLSIGSAHSEEYAKRDAGEVLNLLSCAGQKYALRVFEEAEIVEDRGRLAKTFGLSEEQAARAVVGRDARNAILTDLTAECGGGPQPVTCTGSRCFCFPGNDCNTLATSCPTQLTCTEAGCSCDLSGG